MKITQNELRGLIKEEFTKLVSEFGMNTDLLFNSLVSSLRDQGVEVEYNERSKNVQFSKKGLTLTKIKRGPYGWFAEIDLSERGTPSKKNFSNSDFEELVDDIVSYVNEN